VLFKAYDEIKVRDPQTTLSVFIDKFADLPLNFHPGTSWEYSYATDVLGRVVEVVSGETLEAFTIAVQTSSTR
jgi:CubicO group peptidase (beta-lactamase class C family)